MTGVQTCALPIWTFAKPTAGRQEAFWLDTCGVVGLAGDEWAGGPRVEAAWLSGAALGQALAAALGAEGTR